MSVSLFSCKPTATLAHQVRGNYQVMTPSTDTLERVANKYVEISTTITVLSHADQTAKIGKSYVFNKNASLRIRSARLKSSGLVWLLRMRYLK